MNECFSVHRLQKEKKKPILVGGSAVEFYTRGMSKNIDMDIVADRKVIEPLLIGQGFLCLVSKTTREPSINY